MDQVIGSYAVDWGHTLPKRSGIYTYLNERSPLAYSLNTSGNDAGGAHNLAITVPSGLTNSLLVAATCVGLHGQVYAVPTFRGVNMVNGSGFPTYGNACANVAYALNPSSGAGTISFYTSNEGGAYSAPWYITAWIFENMAQSNVLQYEVAASGQGPNPPYGATGYGLQGCIAVDSFHLGVSGGVTMNTPNANQAQLGLSTYSRMLSETISSLVHSFAGGSNYQVYAQAVFRMI